MQRSMSGKGKRRSARLLKLEEQKTDDDVDACRLDPLQIIRNTISGASRGKGKKNGEIQVKLIIGSFEFFFVPDCVCISWSVITSPPSSLPMYGTDVSVQCHPASRYQSGTTCKWHHIGLRVGCGVGSLLRARTGACHVEDRRRAV